MTQTKANVYRLNDILEYLDCPLKGRYQLLTGIQTPGDVREVVVRAATVGIGGFLREAASPRGSSPERAMQVAHAAYRRELESHREMLSLKDPFLFLQQHMNTGLALLNQVAGIIGRHDVPVHGPVLDASVELGDNVVVGEISGLISFNDREITERRYGIVQVCPRQKVMPSWGRVRDGFSGTFMRKQLEKLRPVPLEIVNIDPHTQKISRIPILKVHLSDFAALSAAAIQGMEAEAFPPQPSKTRCGTCPFEKACDFTMAVPDLPAWRVKDFIKKMGR